jgi:hypothetical protein
MKQKKVKPVYVAPQAVDLSPMNAHGQVRPQGECVGGARPYANCVTGTQFIGACANGSTPDTSACSVGNYHTTPTCQFGSVAATICISGANQQWA